VPRAILFDLDGTLVDTRAASWQLFAETNRAFTLGIDTQEAFFKAFEGNFFDSLARLVPDPKRAADAKAHFMDLLRTRYHPAVIPGMVDVVRALAPQCTLAVLSTNGIEAIRRVLVGAGIATCFSHVFSGDVEPRKAASMRRFLADQRYATHRQCSPAYQDGADAAQLQAQEVVLVTDTVGDVAEAREAGVRAIGVSWGMHTEKQLLDAGAERVALWPQELVAWLRDADSAVPAGACCTPMQAQTHAQAQAQAPNCACAAPAQTAAGSTATPPVTQPELDPVAEAGRVRDTRRLQARQAQAAALATAAPAAPFIHTPPTGAVPSELLRALQRIMPGGDAVIRGP
jgi:phosphoglycolate phosphatase